MPEPTMKRKTGAVPPPPKESESVEEAPEEDWPDPSVGANEPLREDPDDASLDPPEDPDELPTTVIVDLLASMAASLAVIAGTLKSIDSHLRGVGDSLALQGTQGGRPAVQKTMFGTPNMNKTSNKPPTGPTCPSCGIPMVRRNGNRGPFWGCHNFPGCRQTAKYTARYEEEEE